MKYDIGTLVLIKGARFELLLRHEICYSHLTNTLGIVIEIENDILEIYSILSQVDGKTYCFFIEELEEVCTT